MEVETWVTVFKTLMQNWQYDSKMDMPKQMAPISDPHRAGRGLKKAM